MPTHLVACICSDAIPCEFAGRMAVDAGLRVVKIEPPGGDALRDTRGRLADWLLAGKESICWGPDALDDGAIRTLLDRCDAVLVDDWGDARLRALMGERIAARVVRVGERDSAGLAGMPDARSDEFLGFHGAGLGFLTPRVMPGYPSGDPLCPRANLLEFMVGLHGAIALFALLATPAGEGPTAASVGWCGAALPLLRREIAAVQLEGAQPHRAERIWKVSPAEVHRCRDGWVFVDVIEDVQWKRLCEWMGQPPLAADPRYATREQRFAQADALCAVLDAFFAGLPQDCWRDAQQHGVPVAPVNDLQDLCGDEQLAHRGFWGSVVDARGTSLRAPRTPLARLFGADLPPLHVHPPGHDNVRYAAMAHAAGRALAP